MRIRKKWFVFLAVGLLVTLGGVAQAALTPVFEYSFPASYDGSTTTVTDQSSAGNNATMKSADAYVEDLRPWCFTSGGSISGAQGGYAITNAIDLLTNQLVAAHGGFTLDTWVMFDDESQLELEYGHQFLSYAGTDALAMRDGIFYATMYTPGVSSAIKIDGPVIEMDRWYHLMLRFDTTGNELNADGYIAGEASLLVNGVVVNSRTIVRDAFGDNLDRPIGINCRGYGSISNPGFVSKGYVYNPKVYLGVEDVVSPKIGDANGDGSVDGFDAEILAAHWLTTSDANWWGTGDFNADKIVDDIDATMLAANWTATSSSASVPEPSLLAALAGLLIMLSIRYEVCRVRRN